MVKIGIIGLDNWYHAIPIAEYCRKYQNFELIAVSSENRERVNEFARRFGVRNSYTDWKQVVRNDDVDAVIICNPSCKRLEPALGAIRANKHVLCDKPMTFSIKDADKIVNAVEGSKIHFAMLHNYRLTPRIFEAKKLLKKKLIGKLSSITYSCRKPLPEDWPGSGVPGWYADPKLSGGGGFVDHAAHTLDVVLWYAEGNTPVAVQGSMQNLTRKDFPGEDYGVALIEFEDDLIVTQESTWTAPKNVGGSEYIQITGEKGEILVCGTGRAYIEVRRAANGPAYTERIDVKEPVWTDIVNSIVDNFVKSIEGKAKLFDGIGVREGRNVVRLLDSIYKSAATGKRVTLV